MEQTPLLQMKVKPLPPRRQSVYHARRHMLGALLPTDLQLYLADFLHACMMSTFFIFSFQAATVMTALVGICWSLTLWAPFALISADIAQRDEERRRKARQKLMNPNEEWHQPEESDQAGIILGLHNVAVSAPQVFSTMVCSAIFKVLQKPRDEPGDASVGWTLRFGGMTTLIAVWLTYRMKEPGERA